MYKNHCVAVVAPAYNEERFIGQVIRTMPTFIDNIIVVDDCSQDSTSQVAAAQGDHRVLILKTPHNQGVGGATLVFYAMHKGYFFENDMLIQLNLHGVRVKDFTLLPLFLVIKFEGNNLISNINGTYRI